MIINTKDGLANGLEESKYELSILTVPNLGNKNNKGCMLKINKNLEVAPQILKSATMPPSQNSSRAVQWVNENETKSNMQMNPIELNFRKSMFQVWALYNSIDCICIYFLI